MFNRQTILSILAAGTLVLITGCANSPNHDKWVNQAESRWLKARSDQMLQMAQKHFNAGDLNQTEAGIADALQYDPLNPELHLLAGRVALERGQLERAYNRFQNSIDQNDKSSRAHYYQGVVLQRWQRYADAYDRYTKAYELEPDRVAYIMAMAEMLVALDKMDDALILLEDKARYFDQSASIRGALGQLHMVRQEHEAAVMAFQDAVLLHPTDTGMKENLATARMAAGQYTEAIMELEYLTNTEELKDRIDLKQALAAGYANVGRLEEARHMLYQVSRRYPRDAGVWIQLGEVCWRLEDYSATHLAATRAMAVAPVRPEGFLLAGLVMRKRGQTAQAVRMFEQASRCAPTSSDAHLLRGMTLQDVGEYEAAGDAYRSAMAVAPDDHRARRLLAGLESMAIAQ